MDLFLTNTINIIQPIIIKKQQKIRQTKDIKAKIPNNIKNEPIIKKI